MFHLRARFSSDCVCFYLVVTVGRWAYVAGILQERRCYGSNMLRLKPSVGGGNVAPGSWKRTKHTKQQTGGTGHFYKAMLRKSAGAMPAVRRLYGPRAKPLIHDVSCSWHHGGYTQRSRDCCRRRHPERHLYLERKTPHMTPFSVCGTSINRARSTAGSEGRNPYTAHGTPENKNMLLQKTRIYIQ